MKKFLVIVACLALALPALAQPGAIQKITSKNGSVVISPSSGVGQIVDLSASGGGSATNAIANFYPATLKGSSTNPGTAAFDFYLNSVGDGWNGVSNLFPFPAFDLGFNRPAASPLQLSFNQRAGLNVTVNDYATGVTNLQFTNELSGIAAFSTYPLWSTNLSGPFGYPTNQNSSWGNHAGEDAFQALTIGRVDTAGEFDTYGAAVNGVLIVSDEGTGSGKIGATTNDAFAWWALNIRCYETNNDTIPLQINDFGVPYQGALLSVLNSGYPAFLLSGPYNTPNGVLTNGGQYDYLLLHGNFSAIGGAFSGEVTVSNTIISSGPNSEYALQDQADPSSAWALFANGGKLAIFSSVYGGNVITVSTNAIMTVKSNLVAEGSILSFGNTDTFIGTTDQNGNGTESIIFQTNGVGYLSYNGVYNPLSWDSNFNVIANAGLQIPFTEALTNSGRGAGMSAGKFYGDGYALTNLNLTNVSLIGPASTNSVGFLDTNGLGHVEWLYASTNGGTPTLYIHGSGNEKILSHHDATFLEWFSIVISATALASSIGHAQWFTRRHVRKHLNK